MLAELLFAIVIATTPVPCEPYSDEVDELAGYELKTEQDAEAIERKGECLGEFEITAYGYNEGYGENFQTATGATPEPYKTVAVDPDVIPLGSVLYIEGIGEVQAQDTGGAVKGNVIDLHIGTGDCEQWGRQVHKVYKR